MVWPPDAVFSWLLSLSILCIGFIIAGFVDEESAPDRICDTRVVRGDVSAC
jgi:hypothetical protein